MLIKKQNVAWKFRFKCILTCMCLEMIENLPYKWSVCRDMVENLPNTWNVYACYDYL